MSTTKTFSKLLIWMAENSPPSYAEHIRTRNLALLGNLSFIEPYIGKTFSEVPMSVFLAYTAEVPYGCPHCFGICHRYGPDHDMRCLWARAAKRFASPGQYSDATPSKDAPTVPSWTDGLPCCDPVFPPLGINFGAVSLSSGSLSLSYGHSHAGLRLGGFGGRGYINHARWQGDTESHILRADYDKVQAFLQAHVDWSNLENWGTAYVAPTFPESSVPATPAASPVAD